MSLLLESLKKAALEKQKKEKGAESLAADNAKSEHKESDNEVSGGHHKKMELEEMEIEGNEKNSTEAEVEFNSEEFEFVVESEATTSDRLPPEKEQPEIKSTDVIENNPVTEKNRDTEVDAVQPEKNNIADIGNNPEKQNKIHSFTPESGKAALASLLEKNKKIEKSGKIRSIYIMGLLLITGLGTLGGYYYFLMDDTNSISPTNQLHLYTHENNTAVTDIIETENPITETTSEFVNDSVNSAALQEIIQPESNVVNNEQPVAVDESQEKNQTVKTPESVSKEKIRNQVAEKPAPIIKADEPNGKQARVKSQPIESYIQSQPQVEDAIAQQVSAAYKAYQQGQWDKAQVLYENVLMQDAYNRDALLGAAAVAVRQGKAQEALGYYQQQLERDPQDEYAVSGIMALSLDANKTGLLSEIDRRLQEKPASVHLLFLKGSILAGQQQWSVAQEVFFEAWRYDKANADIAYNLAICLDRLNQPHEAIRFYEMALSLKTAGANFSSANVEKRLASLTRSIQ